MYLIKLKFLKEGNQVGKPYIYSTPHPVSIGDTVQINSAAKGVVVEVDVPEEEVAAFADKVKSVKGLVEEVPA